MNTGLTLLVLTSVLALGLIFTEASAEISPDNSFIIEGSGYLATEQSIQTSEVDIILITGAQTGSRTSVEVETGFITINDDDYIIATSSASSLREGKYLRISATAESSDTGNEITISTLGRLIQNSQDGSIYTFSGRLVDRSTEYKIIYITQLSDLSGSVIAPTTEQTTSDVITVRISEGASNSALTTSYIDKSTNQLAGYFSQDRLTIEPGTSVTFVNDDTVSHTLVSGTGLAGTRSTGEIIICAEEEDLSSGSSYTQNNCDFTLDGRLNSGIIGPGDSWTATFEEMGFYRLIDTDYPWMNIVAYTFPESDNSLIRQGSVNEVGN